jgi:hypothetical protein
VIPTVAILGCFSCVAHFIFLNVFKHVRIVKEKLNIKDE